MDDNPDNTAMQRGISLLDRLIGQADQTLRMLAGDPVSARVNPAAEKPEAGLDADDLTLCGRLMRVNHSGEVAAQALYHGQALTSRATALRQTMKQAAREENDHLAWTAGRVHELGARLSYLNPLWYTGSLALGMLAGVAGDRWNLGFLAETERQVVEHLEEHLSRLPAADVKSRAILEQMRTDEAHHATIAVHAGAAELPAPVKSAMRVMSKLMTRTAFWI